MEVHLIQTVSELPPDSALVLICCDDSPILDTVEEQREQVQALDSAGRLSRSRFERSTIYGHERAPALVIVGGGDSRTVDDVTLMRLAAAGTKEALRAKYRVIAFHDSAEHDSVSFARIVVEGAIRGAYDPGIRKTAESKTPPLEKIVIVSGECASGHVLSAARRGQIIGEANCLARDLVNSPANDLTPSRFAERAEQEARACGMRCDVLDEEAMNRLGMGALLGVSSGSAEPARLIRLRFGDDGSRVKLAFVGKGLTFDSGGLSLKSADGMESMKHDMGGGGAVLAGMVAIARLGVGNISVTGYIGATENMPGGSAMRPGDVLTALNGETIEVLNTDAEGRLVLADVLSLAKQEGATHIVDFATLTGGAVVALGTACSVAAGRPDSWVQRVVACANSGLERAWHMPLLEEYRRAMDSDVADIKNTGGRYASPMTASAFLSDFTSGVDWTHIDIAGTSWADRGTAYQAPGATGEGVGTMVAVALDLAGAS